MMYWGTRKKKGGHMKFTANRDGRYIPNLPAPFGGVINMKAKDSKPH